MSSTSTPSITRLQTTSALVVTAASLAICGAALMARPFPAGAGPVGPAVAVTSPLPQVAGIVRPTTDDPIGTTDRVADQAISTVRAVRDDALRTAGTTVNTAIATATDTVATAVATVGQVEAIAMETVGSVTTTALSTVADVETLAVEQVATALCAARTVVGQATTLVVSLTKVGATADMDLLNATGTITVSAGDAVLARAELEQGKAIVTVTAPLLGTTQLTLTYGGDALFAPSTLAL